MDMVLKIRPLSFVLLMIMIFSIAVSGQDERKPNLLIGGVWQTAEDQAQNREYARLFDAEYLPTYYSRTKNPYSALDKTTITGKVLADINTNEASAADAVAKAADVAAVIAATPTIIAIRDPSIPVGTYLPGHETPIMYKPIYTPNDLNGLTNHLISKGPLNSADHYGTIYAHSGGARTAVTALLYQNVTADKLVLISPANGGEDDELNKQELQALLDSKKVGEIVLYQSSDPKADAAFMNDLWQTRFEKSDISGNFKIEPVTNEQLLEKKGEEGHIQMWYTVLNLELGRDPTSPASVSTEIQDEDLSDVQSAEDWFNKGKALYAQGKYGEAITAFDKAIEINPQYEMAWAVKADCLTAVGRPEEAIEAADMAIELDSQHANPWAYKACAFRQLGRYEEALSAIDRAVSIDPNYGGGWYDKGTYLKLLGRTTEANAALAKAKELGYTG